MFLSTSIHSKKLFQTITQPFYIASNRTLNKKSAGVKNYKWSSVNSSRRSNNPPGRKAAEGVLQRMGQIFEEKFFSKKLTVPKIVAQCRKHPNPYLNTLRDHSISLYITKNTTLVDCRNYTLPYYIAETMTYLNTLPKKTLSLPKHTLS